MKKRILMTAPIGLALLFGTTLLPVSSAATTTTGSAPLFQDNCVVRGDDDRPLRVRSTPGGRVIGSLKIGANILAYGIEQDNYGNDWTKIRFKRGYGFVSTQYVSCG